MKTAPTAGKSWQPSHEPPHGREKRAPIIDIIVEREGRNRGGETTSEQSPCT